MLATHFLDCAEFSFDGAIFFIDLLFLPPVDPTGVAYIDWRTTDEGLCIEFVMFDLSELSEFCYLASRIILDLYIDNYIGLHQRYFVHILSEFGI